MSQELIYAILLLLSGTTSQVNVLFIDNVDLTIEEFSIPDHSSLEGLRFGFGIEVDVSPYVNTHSQSIARQFEVYFNPNDVNQNQVEEYIQMTNFWLDMLMVGHRIEPIYMPLSSQSNLNDIVGDIRLPNIASDRIVFTSGSLPVSSNFHAVGENWKDNGGTINGIIVQLLPSGLGSSTYVFDPRILVHEFLHNSILVHDNLNCKSIMHGSLGPNVGWGSIKLIQNFNKINASDIFTTGYSNPGLLDNLNFPTETNDTCLEGLYCGYLQSLTSIEYSQAPTNFSEFLAMIDIANSVDHTDSSFLKMLENDVFDLSGKAKEVFEINNLKSMIVNADLYYRSLIEHRTLSYINQRIKSGDDISQFTDKITNRSILKTLNK